MVEHNLQASQHINWLVQLFGVIASNGFVLSHCSQSWSPYEGKSVEYFQHNYI